MTERRTISFPTELWLWVGKKWKWDGILSAGAFGLLKLGEYAVALVLLLIAVLAVISRIGQWNGPAREPRWGQPLRTLFYGFVLIALAFLSAIIFRIKGEHAWSNLLPRHEAAVENTARIKTLSGPDRSNFVAVLKAQTDPRDTVEFACARSSETACERASIYLTAFSEAGWPMKSEYVNRVEIPRPTDGISIVSRSQAPPGTHLPPHMGWWSKMDASQVTIWSAFRSMGYVPKSTSADDLGSNELIIYFGPEIDH